MWQTIRRGGYFVLAFLLLTTPSLSLAATAKKKAAVRSKASAKRSKASAKVAVRSKASAKTAATKKPPKPPYQAYLVVEATSGHVLAEHNADKPWPPASLAKMMLTLIVLEEVERGNITWKTPVTVSPNASRVGGSRVFLKPGETYPLETLMRAVEVASANDAATAVAEAVAGSAQAMVRRMNARAKELGLKKTRFVNVHGLPPERGAPDNLTTAREMATLGRVLVTQHPKIFEWSAQVEAPFREGRPHLLNTNHAFLRGFPGADGLKTGYHAGALYNLVATAERNGTRLLAVLLGSPSLATRYAQVTRLLEEAFAKRERRVVLKKGERLPDLFYVEGSEHQYIALQAGEDLSVFAEKDVFSRIRLQLAGTPSLKAPLNAGFPAGHVLAVLDGRTLASVPAVVSRDVPKASWIWRVWNWRTPKPTAEEFLARRVAPSLAGF